MDRELFEYTMDFDNALAFGRIPFPVLREIKPRLENKKEEEEEKFSPEEAKRFSSFYADLRDDIQDLHLSGHDPVLFKAMREKREALVTEKMEEEEEIPHPPIRKREVRRKLHSLEKRFAGSK